MPVSDDYLAFLRDRFSFLGDLRIKKMFGGAMLYADDLPFALAADDVLYFKVGETNREAFENTGMPMFQPYPGKPVNMPYRELPADILEDPQALERWAAGALTAARAAKK